MTGAVPVRDAATVVLLRDGAAGIEAWLLTRVRQMVFAAGMTVFPGGRVDDGDAALPVEGSDLDAVAARFDASAALAHAMVGAAARETFEETGVLLTVPSAPVSAALVAARDEVEAGRRSFGSVLAEHDLSVDGAALHPWARWVTPAGEVRRYDTRFFVAALPPGAEALDVTTESSVAGWHPVAVALEAVRHGELVMLPPTVATLASLLTYGRVEEVLAASDERDLDAVRPEFVTADDGSAAVRLPTGELVPLLGNAR